MHIRFDKVDGAIKIYDEIKYLELSNLYEVYYRINYRIYIMQFLIGLIILKVKKVMINIVLIIISQESELTYIILYLQKKIDFSCYNTH